jgi:Lactonase, 7-bladed beta-propeller
MAIDPSGKFAYVANQVSNNVSAYMIDASSGALTPIAGSPFAAGQSPISIAVDLSGKFAYVTNHGANNLSAYSINPVTGALTPIAGSPFATGLGPTQWQLISQVSSSMCRTAIRITLRPTPSILRRVCSPRWLVRHLRRENAPGSLATTGQIQ